MVKRKWIDIEQWMKKPIRIEGKSLLLSIKSILL